MKGEIKKEINWTKGQKNQKNKNQSKNNKNNSFIEG